MRFLYTVYTLCRTCYVACMSYIDLHIVSLLEDIYKHSLLDWTNSSFEYNSSGSKVFRIHCKKISFLNLKPLDNLEINRDLQIDENHSCNSDMSSVIKAPIWKACSNRRWIVYSLYHSAPFLKGVRWGVKVCSLSLPDRPLYTRSMIKDVTWLRQRNARGGTNGNTWLV